MDGKFKRLLEPGRIGTMSLKNRVVIPPMFDSIGSRDGHVTDKSSDFRSALKCLLPLEL